MDVRFIGNLFADILVSLVGGIGVVVSVWMHLLGSKETNRKKICRGHRFQFEYHKSFGTSFGGICPWQESFVRFEFLATLVIGVRYVAVGVN